MKSLIILLLSATILAGCSNYGEKVVYDGTEVYYKDGATKTDADAVGKALQEMEFTDGTAKSVMVTKDSIYNFRMVTQDVYHTDTSVDINFQAVGYLLSNDAFNGESLNFQICDEVFKTKRNLYIEGSPKNNDTQELEKGVDDFEGVEANDTN